MDLYIQIKTTWMDPTEGISFASYLAPTVHTISTYIQFPAQKRMGGIQSTSRSQLMDMLLEIHEYEYRESAIYMPSIYSLLSMMVNVKPLHS